MSVSQNQGRGLIYVFARLGFGIICAIIVLAGLVFLIVCGGVE